MTRPWVPAIPGNRPLTGPGPTIADFVSSWASPRAEFQGTRLGNRRVARGRLRCGNDYVTVELHTDGAGWARYKGGSVVGYGELIIRADDLETYIVELLAILGGYAAWTGATGDCAVRVWLYGGIPEGVTGALVSRVGLRRDRRHGDLRWLEGQLPGPAETTVPVDELATDRQHVGVAAYPLARDIEQDWGLPEPEALQSDGTFGYV